MPCQNTLTKIPGTYLKQIAYESSTYVASAKNDIFGYSDPPMCTIILCKLLTPDCLSDYDE